MPLPRASRVRLIWWLELGLGLELYACAVLALHARGLRATPLVAAPSLVIPALVIPPVFYLLVGLVSMRPLSLPRVLGAAAAMCGLHALLVVATGALYTIPDLVDFGAAVAFALWGSPAVTLLQLTAAPLVFARLRPLLLTPRLAPRATPPPRSAETPASATPRTLGAARVEAPSFPDPRGPVATSPAPPAQRAPAAPTATAPKAREPAMASPLAPPPARPPVVTPPTAPPSPLAGLVKPAVSSGMPSTPFQSVPSVPARRPAPDSADAMVRVPFSRIADQLPVEMFVRGREGLNATLRPGVSLLVPRRLILSHLGDGLAPVQWQAVADQFPRDELALSHDEIAKRLPNGSLLLPLDEVVPQIPPELLALSTPAVDVYGIEEFPPPFQPHVPPASEISADDPGAPPAHSAVAPGEPEAATASEPLEEPEPPAEPETPAEPELVAEPETTAEPEPVLEPEPVPEPEVLAELERLAEPELLVPDQATAGPAERGRTAEARRIATLLVPLMNGLEIGERADAGTTFVTVVAPPLSEDSVVRSAARLVPYLTDARLFAPVTQATLAAADATIVVTPFGSPDAGGAILVAAVASRASLAWLERLSRSAAGGARGGARNGEHSGPRGESGGATELRVTTVPPSVRELAGSLTAFGPVAPTVLRDTAGSLRACLFLPSSLEALPLAQFAWDLYGALGEADLGEVSSVVLRVGAHRLVLRAMDGASGGATMLVGGGPIDRLGLARIELDRAATRLGALVRG